MPAPMPWGTPARQVPLLFPERSRQARARKRQIGLLLAAGLVVGCMTAKPILYSNEKYQQAGKAGVDRDIAECKALADQAGATPGAGKGGQVAKGAGVGAVAGAAAGTVGGAIWGNPGTGAASGAVSGVVGGLLWPLIGGG